MKPRKPDLWFWSDPHFEHKHAIRHNQRPFSSTHEMNEGMIRSYNSVVKPQDTTIWVGDSFFCGSIKAKEIMRRLNGRKILVSGNHDGTSWNSLNCGFDFVCEKLVLVIAEQEVHVVHYPYAEPLWFTWTKAILGRKRTKYLDRRIKNQGKWLIHGHTHSKFKLRGREIHVGVDAWNFTPVHESVIEKIITTGRLPNGQGPDNEYKYHLFWKNAYDRFIDDLHWLRFLGRWGKAVARLWRH